MMKLVLALIVLIVVITLLVRLSEPGFAFFPLAGETTTPNDFGISHQTLSIATEDGETLRAWALSGTPQGPASRRRAHIVYFHGNGGNLSVWTPILAGIARQGYSVLAVDYRGYGKSTGRPSEPGLYRDVDAVVRSVWKKPQQDGPIVYWGRSLGATMAAYAATVRPPDGLILESAFPDVRTLVRSSPPMMVLSLFSTFRFPAAEFMQRVSVPVLMMHGDRDSVIPFAQGRALFEKVPGPKQFFTIRGGDHNDAVAPDPHSYWEAVDRLVGAL
jgi:uncharacterized protein